MIDLPQKSGLLCTNSSNLLSPADIHTSRSTSLSVPWQLPDSIPFSCHASGLIGHPLSAFWVVQSVWHISSSLQSCFCNCGPLLSGLLVTAEYGEALYLSFLLWQKIHFMFLIIRIFAVFSLVQVFVFVFLTSVQLYPL